MTNNNNAFLVQRTQRKTASDVTFNGVELVVPYLQSYSCMIFYQLGFSIVSRLMWYALPFF